MRESPAQPSKEESTRRKRARLRRTGTRRRRRLKLALVAQSSQLFNSFTSLCAAEDLEVVHIDPRGLSQKAREAQGSWARFDAVVLDERSRNIGSGLVRAIRKANPEVPLISLGGRPGTEIRSFLALHLQDLPPSGRLRSLIQDARQQLLLNRKAANLSRRLRETSRRLQVLGEIVATANSILEPRRVINVIMSQIQELIPSEAWSILLVDEETGDLAFEMALGEKSSDLNDTRIKLGEGVAGWVAQTGEPAIVNDVRRDRRFQAKFDELTRFRTRSILCAPLISRGRTIGPPAISAFPQTAHWRATSAQSDYLSISMGHHHFHRLYLLSNRAWRCSARGFLLYYREKNVQAVGWHWDRVFRGSLTLLAI